MQSQPVGIIHLSIHEDLLNIAKLSVKNPDGDLTKTREDKDKDNVFQTSNVFYIFEKQGVP